MGTFSTKAEPNQPAKDIEGVVHYITDITAVDESQKIFVERLRSLRNPRIYTHNHFHLVMGDNKVVNITCAKTLEVVNFVHPDIGDSLVLSGPDDKIFCVIDSD